MRTIPCSCSSSRRSGLSSPLHAGRSVFRNEGRRVVEGQRRLQATSGIFLGWTRVNVRGESVDLHVRQLWDWKVSADIEEMSASMMHAYGRACGWTLAGTRAVR